MSKFKGKNLNRLSYCPDGPACTALRGRVPGSAGRERGESGAISDGSVLKKHQARGGFCFFFFARTVNKARLLKVKAY